MDVAGDQDVSNRYLIGWFEGSDKPVRPGVYERRRKYMGHTQIVFALWTGKRWNANAPTVEQARENKECSMYSDLPWRGLTSAATYKRRRK